MFASPAQLHEAIASLSKEFDFTVRREGCAFKCARAQLSVPRKKEEDKLRNRKSMKVDCPFKIKFSWVDRKPKDEWTEDDKKKKGVIRKTDLIKMTQLCCNHGPLCDLNVGEMQVIMKRGGHLCKFESTATAPLVNQVANDPDLSANSIRSSLKKFMPEGVCMTAMDINNFRIWCKRNVDRIQDDGGIIHFDPSEIGI